MKFFKETVKKYGNARSEKGFTLFIAMIVSSLMLLVGFSIGNIVLKQLLLASASAASQTAFFAADGGQECALYWNYRSATGTSGVEGPFATSTTASTTYNYIDCGFGDALPGANGGNVLIKKFLSADTQYATTTFFIDLTDPTPPTGSATAIGSACSKVVVAVTPATTTIYSRGYNAPYNPSGYDPILGENGCNTANPRTVERGLQTTF